MISKLVNKNILIKTYLFESGLFYLAKSLGDVLSRHNNVVYVPKAKYLKSGPRHDRSYPSPIDSELLSDINYVPFLPNKSVESQIIDACKSYDIHEIISFETFMKKAQWVTEARDRCNVNVHDVPMPEWVGANFLLNKSYKVFDSIWCLTDVSKKMFSSYKNAISTEWEYSIGFEVFPSNREGKKPIFYHQASLNPNFSQKNTLEVIRAFIILERQGYEHSLYITGRLSAEEARLAKKSKNIILINNILSKNDVAKLYSQAHCVVAPSTREGLGLSFYEAKKAGCSIITTNVVPMNHHTDYLCEVISYNKDRSMIPHAVTNAESIFKQIKRFCEDFKMTKDIEIKKKTKQQIDEENESLMSAFEGAGDTTAEPEESTEGSLNEDTLNALREKMQKKSQKSEKEDTMDVVNTRSVAIELAVIGVGQAGSRIAEVFHKKGYDAGVINTSAQDLEYIEVLDTQKLLLEGSLGGTGKDLDLGREIFEDNVSTLHGLACHQGGKHLCHLEHLWAELFYLNLLNSGSFVADRYFALYLAFVSPLVRLEVF